MSSAVYTTKRLDYLGLIAEFCQEIDLVAIIDKVLGTSQPRQLSYGHIFTGMLLNGLGFTGRILHMYSEFFDDKPVSRLIGEGIEASHINVDAFWRCLDALYDEGVCGLDQKIAERSLDTSNSPVNSPFRFNQLSCSGQFQPDAFYYANSMGAILKVHAEC